MSIVTKATSLLRPFRKTSSSQDEAQIQLCRQICLAGAVLIPLFGLLHTYSTPGAFDSLGARLGVSALFAGLLIASYLSKRIRQSLGQAVHALFYVVLILGLLLAAVNNFLADYSVAFMGAFASMLAVLGLGTQSLRSLLWFSGTGLIALGVGIAGTATVHTSPPVLLGTGVLIAFVEGAVVKAYLTTSSRLQEREARLDSIAENVSEGLYRSTPDDGLIYANQALVDMFGYETEEEMAQVDPASLYADPSVRETLRQREAEQGEINGVEVEYRRKDGSTFVGLLHTSPAIDEEGTIRYHDGTVADITQQKQTENRLREQEARLRGLAHSIPGVVYQFYARPDGSYGYHFVSDRTEEILGISSDTDGLYERIIERVPPSHRADLEASIDEAVREETRWRFETPFETPSGERLWLLGTATPERRDDELVYTGVILDITERKDAQRELERTKEKFEQVFENSNDAILITDIENNRFVDCNQAAADLVGVSREELCSMTPSDLHPHNYSDVKDWTKTVFDQGSARTDDLTCRRCTGEIIPVEASAGVAEFEENSCLVINVVDITERKKRARALREERDRFETLFENLPTPVVHCTATDDKTLIADANSAFEDVFGIEAADAEGRDVNDFLVPDGREHEAAQIEQGAFEAGTRKVEVRRKTDDGERHFRLQAAGRTPENGPPELYAIYTDITERKERERELRRKERQYQAVFEDPHTLTALLAPDGTTLDVNRTAMEYVDAAKEDVLGLPFWETAFWEEELQPKIRNIVERAAEEEYVEFEADHPQRGFYTMGVVRPVTDQSGEVVSLVVTGRDITERKRREQEIEQKNAILRAILNNLPAGVLAEDASRNILATNERLCELFDVPLSPSDLEGRHGREEAKKVAHLFPEPDDFLDRIEERLAERKPVLGEELELSDGRVYERAFVPYSLPDGDAALWLYRDVTDRKEREQELMKARDEAREASRAKSAFLANMSHEIRTPLTSILGFAEAIGDETERLKTLLEEHAGRGQMDSLDVDLSPLTRFAQLIEQGGHRLLETLDGVLNLSKLEAGEMNLEGKPVDLASEVKATVEQLRPQAQETDLALTVDIEDAPLRANANEGGVQIVVRNLISNAIKYTDAGGQVCVRAWTKANQVVLEVEDTGIGMAEARVPDLFEAFRQESEGTDREYEGTGLGLTLTKRILGEMGGSIDVETEKGTGTCFTVRLPRATEGRDVEA